MKYAASGQKVAAPFDELKNVHRGCFVIHETSILDRGMGSILDDGNNFEANRAEASERAAGVFADLLAAAQLDPTQFRINSFDHRAAMGRVGRVHRGYFLGIE